MVERSKIDGVSISTCYDNPIYYNSFKVKGLEKNTLQLSRVFLSIHKTIFVEQR